MRTERENENKVKKYADENNFTILANTFGSLEYVKYCYGKIRSTTFLKWSKGSDTMTITNEGSSKKINLSEV